MYAESVCGIICLSGGDVVYDDSFRKRYGIAPVAISSTAAHNVTYPYIHNKIELLVIMQGIARVKIVH